MAQQVSCEQVSQWFLKSIHGRLDDNFFEVCKISEQNKRILKGGNRMDISAQTTLRSLREDYSPGIRDLLPEAVAKATAAWDKEKHGLRGLRNLAWFVSDLRATGALGPLQRYAEVDLLPLYRCPGDADVLSTVVGVVAGFAHEVPQARQAVEGWLEEPRLARLTATLVNTLCFCSPHDYPTYLPRFFQAAGEHPSYFETEGVVREMTRRVTFPVVASELYRLPEGDLSQFLKALTARPDPTARLTINPPSLHPRKEQKSYPCFTPTIEDRTRLESIFQPFL